MSDQSPPPADFVAMILTHGRPDRVITYQTLRRSGYTGPILLVVDDEDETIADYQKRYGADVCIFSKEEISKTFDLGDNFPSRLSTNYARNAIFDIAKEKGFRYFIQLDDDYQQVAYRFDEHLLYDAATTPVRNLNRVFSLLLDGFKQMRLDSLAISQGGDWIGGSASALASSVRLMPKAINTFICDTERRFQFVGRMNEDVNTYTAGASKGLMRRQSNQLAIVQVQTQTNAGGMTDLYLDSGTYVKSFYSVMMHPSGVQVQMMPGSKKRLHHRVSWDHTSPKIIAAKHRKG